MPALVRGGFAMKRNHSSAIPRYIISLDTETIPSDYDKIGLVKSHTLRLGVAISVRIQRGRALGREVCHFTTADELYKFIESKTSVRHTVWVVAHNMLFDFIVSCFPDYFSQGLIQPDWPRGKRKQSKDTSKESPMSGLCCVNSPPTIICAKYVSTQGRVVFCDSLNWFPFPLAEIGKFIGRNKTAMPAFDQPNDVWFPYCENDAEIVLDAFLGLIDFVKSADLGVFRFTSAGQSMSAFRHKYMTHKIYFHDEVQVKALERQAYFGGRSEVFRKGFINEIVHKYDVSSLFPSVMRHKQFPYTLESYEINEDYCEECPAINLSASLAECLIQSKHSTYPVRTEFNTVYPVGIFETTLAGPELSHAAHNGELVAIRSWATYKTADLFTAYVDGLWRMRIDFEDQGNFLYAAFVKRLLISLYGKFGELAPVWEFDKTEAVDKPWSKWAKYNFKTGDTDEYRSFGWYAQKNLGRAEKSNTFPAIAAFVTSYARMRMNQLRHIAGRENVYYQGVDSLIVTPAGRERLEDKAEIRARSIGYLRHELTTNNGEIRGVANYTLAGKHTIAGRAIANVSEIGGRDMQRIFIGKTRLFDGKPIQNILETEIPYNMSNGYTKGNIQPDGWITPLVLTADTSGFGSAVKLLCTDNNASAETKSINV